MCRLFGLTAGTARVRATFWLLDAPDSLEVQSQRNADGSGIGFFGASGEPVVDKQPEPAFSDQEFSRAARQADAHGGDVGTGITAAAGWIADRLPVSSLNTIVAAPSELWALRYPDQHALHILNRPAGGGLHVRSATSSVHVPVLEDAASVVVASEQLDGESGWRMLAPGELVHVRPDLSVHSRIAITRPPARLVPLPADNPNIDT
jgi:predicted glutamine amidotransferase